VRDEPGADGGRDGDDQVFQDGVQANGHARRLAWRRAARVWRTT
jgi:hypothetical protein